MVSPSLSGKTHGLSFVITALDLLPMHFLSESDGSTNTVSAVNLASQ
jgi:hypothetical protein